MSNAASHVVIQGISLGTIIISVTQAIVGGGTIAAIVKAWPETKKIAAERELSNTKVANERETNLLQERAEEMETMRARIIALETKLDHKDALHEAERAHDRHRINNLTACVDSFLLLVKANPDKAAEAAAMIEEMRARQLQTEAAEKAAIHALKINGSAEI